MVQLTDLQGKVMEYILKSIDETGMPPTLREIEANFGWKAVGSAQDVVVALRKKGVLMPPAPGKSRQLVPAPAASQMLALRNEKYVQKGHILAGPPSAYSLDLLPPSCLMVPVLGMVQAGNPREGIENASERVPFLNISPKSDASQYFAVIVEGYSMMNVGFLPGDYLLVEASAGAKNGDVVLAALQDHELTVKRFAMRGSHLYRQAHERLAGARTDMRGSLERMPPALLVPENPDFEPLAFGMSDADKIVGLVRSLYRKEVM